MSEYTGDMQMIMQRLGILESQIRQLRDLVSSQVALGPTCAGADYPYIVRVEEILGGEPIIRGTRTPVRAVVECWRFGDTPEEIVRKLPHLRLAQVFGALSYYDDHRAEIDAYIALNRVPVDD
jgi:uncharacterized protein (DUF433 family)